MCRLVASHHQAASLRHVVGDHRQEGATPDLVRPRRHAAGRGVDAQSLRAGPRPKRLHAAPHWR
jgi:hypothetical protein